MCHVGKLTPKKPSHERGQNILWTYRGTKAAQGGGRTVEPPEMLRGCNIYILYILMGFAKPAMPQGTSHDCCCWWFLESMLLLLLLLLLVLRFLVVVVVVVFVARYRARAARQNTSSKGIFLARACAPWSVIATRKVSQNHGIYAIFSTC